MKIKKRLFVDASFWIALTVKTDKFHKQATQLFSQLDSTTSHLFTSDYVLDESLTRIKRKVEVSLAEDFYQLVEKHERQRHLFTYRVTKIIFNKAYRIFKTQPTPKSFSFTDATNVAVMEKYRIKHLLTFDTDFRALGISVLP